MARTGCSSALGTPPFRSSKCLTASQIEMLSRLAHALVGMGEAQLVLGEPATARTVLEEAEQILVRAGSNPEELARAWFALARALAALGAERSEIALRLDAAATGAADLSDDGELSRQIDTWRTEHRC